MGDIEKIESVNPSVVETFMKQLPEKAIDLGVRVLITLILLFVGLQLIKILRKFIRKSMERAKVEIGAIQFVDSCVKIVLYAILIMTIVVRFGVDATSIVAVIGSLGLTIGLALQGSLANFAGGVLILMMKPFKVGDYIIEDTNKNEGIVTEIRIFYTTLHTIDNRVIVIPNGTLANNSLTNATKMKDRRLDLIVGISYNTDLLKAKEILRNIIESDEEVNKKSEIVVYVDSLGESSVNIGIRVWVKTDVYHPTKWRITENIKLEFDKNGIKIPFRQLDVNLNQKENSKN
ncbi:MAG: mechanosensitive ion channel [Lachnospiraceae bacterium]|nr:mechanosensitive ion channel [Lachnospiraceae bacterium]